MVFCEEYDTERGLLDKIKAMCYHNRKMTKLTGESYITNNYKKGEVNMGYMQSTEVPYIVSPKPYVTSAVDEIYDGLEDVRKDIFAIKKEQRFSRKQRWIHRRKKK